MRLKQLRQRDADLRGEIARVKRERAAIGDAAVRENRKLTDEERASFVALGQKIGELEALLAENTELLEAAEADAAAEVASAWHRPAPDPDADAAARANRAAGIVQMGRDRSADDPLRGFRGVQDFLSSVLVAASTARLDPRLAPLRAAVGSDEQSSFSDPYGGFLVPHGMSPNILALEAENDPLAPLVTRVPMNAPSFSINARTDKNHTSSVSGGLTVSRREQAGDATSSRMEFEKVTMRAYGLFGLAYATEELLTDSPASFIAILEAGFRDEFAAKLLNERIRGTGAGEFTGVLNAPCLVTQAKETGQAADTITKENIDKMVSRCWRYGRAVWLANHDTRPQLRSLSQSVGTGGVVVPYFQGGAQETLDGRPIYFSEFAAKLGDVGDLILGVWSEYLEGTYQGAQQAESIHVRFVQHERAFKFWLRNDGQPWWRAALTPNLSTLTLSPFVVLAAR